MTLLDWLIVLVLNGGVVVYGTVNHTQTMRLLGTRSLWDMKMAALFGVTISIPIMIGCASIGIMGRSLFPDFDPPDALYPHLADLYLGVGLKGLVVAGIVAAAISTFDSMGSSLSAVFTRDVYARLLIRDRADFHYVKVTRCPPLLRIVNGLGTRASATQGSVRNRQEWTLGAAATFRVAAMAAAPPRGGLCGRQLIEGREREGRSVGSFGVRGVSFGSRRAAVPRGGCWRKDIGMPWSGGSSRGRWSASFAGTLRTGHAPTRSGPASGWRRCQPGKPAAGRCGTWP